MPDLVATVLLATWSNFRLAVLDAIIAKLHAIASVISQSHGKCSVEPPAGARDGVFGRRVV